MTRLVADEPVHLRITGSRYYIGIDAVRFLAALLVAVHHLGYTGWTNPRSFPFKVMARETLAVPAIGWGWMGWIGVEIFFVISGVVIANSASGRSAIDFAKGRAVRLFPAAIVCSLIIGALIYFRGITLPHLWLRVLASALLLPIPFWVDPVLWTLSVELVFYTVVFVWIIRSRKPVNLVQLSMILVGWSCIWFVIQILDLPVHETWARLLLLRHAPFFALGMLIQIRSHGPLGSAGRIATGVATVNCMIEISVMTAVSVPGKTSLLYAMPVATWLIAVAIIYYSVVATRGFRQSKFLRRVGLMTYPLYLTHSVVGGSAIYFLYSYNFSVLVSVVSGISLSSIAALLITYIERPLRGMLERFVDLTIRYYLNRSTAARA